MIEERRILQAAQYTRDQLRFELNNVSIVWNKKKDDKSRYEMDVEKLQTNLKSVDEEMQSVNNKYQQIVQQRNETGVSLIDKNDELSILYEKKNVLQSVLKKSDEIIIAKDLEGKQLRLDVKALQRSMEVCRSKLPSDEQQREMAKKYSQLETKLSESKKIVAHLSMQLQVPNPEINPNRYRKIAGNDPSEDQLQSNIAVLNSRLTSQKEQLLEKELILEEVTHLTNKLRMQAVEGHSITLKLAKKMNSVQAQVRKINRQIMSIVSELSMYQANALKYEKEKEILIEVIEDGKLMMKDGNAPFMEAEIEWQHKERENHRTVVNQENGSPHLSDGMVNHRNWTPSSYDCNTPTNANSNGNITENYSNDGIKSRAESRPNAYIADDIGIPKPYGAHAPFKPSILGSNMRHIRKPEHRQVII